MGHTTFNRRFRINPVEIVVFSMIAGVFCYSVYNLFYGYDDLKTAMNSHWRANVAKREVPNRSTASTSQHKEPKAPVNLDDEKTCGPGAGPYRTGGECAAPGFSDIPSQ